MQYALGVTALIAMWCVVVTAVAVIPAVIALLTGRWRLGGSLIATTALPVVLFLGMLFNNALRFAERHAPGEAPEGVMWSMAAVVPTAWCAFMLLVGALSITAATFHDRARRTA